MLPAVYTGIIIIQEKMTHNLRFTKLVLVKYVEKIEKKT